MVSQIERLAVLADELSNLAAITSRLDDDQLAAVHPDIYYATSAAAQGMRTIRGATQYSSRYLAKVNAYLGSKTSKK